MPDPQHRAADVDREAVAATLGRALSDGRLTVDEYEERLAKAYAARTFADLDPLTADLPRAGTASRPAPGPQPAAAPLPRPAGRCAPGPWGRGVRSLWAGWITTALIVTGIWLATSIGNGHPDHFWPVWVIVPWGAVLLARTITDGPRRPHDRHNRYRYR
jgi:hypothetical protein